MKRVGIFSLLLISCFNCYNIRINQKDKIRGIVFERIVPDIHWDSLKNQYIYSNFATFYTKVYYYKDHVLLQSSFEHRSLNLEGLNEEEKRKLAESTPFQLQYFSLIYSNNGNRGWRCDSNNVKSGRIVNKDSLLASEWIGFQQQHDIFKESDHTLVSSITSNEGNITEEYKLRNKKDTTMTGTVIVVFSEKELGFTEFSLAKEIEDLRKMKIIKMKLISDARYIPPKNTFIGRLEIPYELKKITITNEEELIKMFEAAMLALH